MRGDTGRSREPLEEERMHGKSCQVVRLDAGAISTLVGER